MLQELTSVPLRQPAPPVSTISTLHPPSTGRSRKKSRSGCGTCKARKVKCDETKPVCNRCLSTGRTCDGYGAQGGGGNTYLDRYGRHSQPATTSSEVQLSKPLAKSFPSDELRYLELYKQRVSWTSSGWFGYPFWHATVIPALVSEPAILHAVVALSAAHECNFIPGESIDMRERFVLKQYSQAISALQPMLARTSDTQDVAVVLVTCMLFTFLEYLRGRHEIAETHLKNGIKLLGDGRVPRSSFMEQSIVRTFAALVTQRTLFGSDFYLSNPDIFPHSLATLNLPNSIFASPEAAKDALDTILRRITHTEHLLQTSQPHQPSSPSLEKTQSHILTLLDSWQSTYHRTQAHLNSCPPDKDTPAFGSHPGSARTPLSYTLLLMSHSSAQIRAHTLLSPSPFAYASYTHLFHRVLSSARLIHIAYSVAVQIPQNVNFEHSICESGVVASLFYTGIKCRHRCLRRYALGSLKAVPRMEGCWDSAVVANVVERVMGMEDKGVWDGSKEEEKDMATLPEFEELEDEGVVLEEEKLFRSVRVEMRGEGGRAEVRCERVGGDGEVEVVVFEVDNT
ncbi:hypothetical protein COCSADRAFT_222162 [Bipolaris sorokiniana ND90Pr]|uniref:Zn(2)-C6 fungal-type domain-containing protein n=1 Tax=Cochliobolus sativus (strain ND90Pr / ATCC 201652) TaxID=665912 RepID=M2T0M0_COCSN|nr:uncharacterized protein COCSADRAFT_222162 [Bipolaris sorokiniana ND90Pr]EMD62562.1 hypothetical protein COCSADRAFT_222162 [Bipolaris sorokiniana ND90Pr]